MTLTGGSEEELNVGDEKMVSYNFEWVIQGKLYPLLCQNYDYKCFACYS